VLGLILPFSDSETLSESSMNPAIMEPSLEIVSQMATVDD
jgi:hypothetical protein